MKPKYLVALLFSLMIISCNGAPKDYVLEDTWGEDGYWGEKKAIKTVSKPTAKPQESTTKPQETVKPEDVKATPIPEEKTPDKVASETPEKTNTGEPTGDSANELAYTNDKYGYSVESSEDWQSKDSFGSIGAYFTKNIDGNKFDFSIGAIDNLKSENINTKFKKEYIAKLTEKFPNFKITIDKEQAIKNKKLWTIEYTFEKNAEVIQQRQIFIPHRENILVMNWISTEQGFLVGEEEFNSMSQKFVLN